MVNTIGHTERSNKSAINGRRPDRLDMMAAQLHHLTEAVDLVVQKIPWLGDVTRHRVQDRLQRARRSRSHPNLRAVENPREPPREAPWRRRRLDDLGKRWVRPP